jgi:hypothetical protein
LIVLTIGLLACGPERAADPVTPLDRDVQDTVGVLRAVSSLIIQTNARMSGLRASADYPASCRQEPFACWSIPTDRWQVSSDDRAAILLAEILGVQASRRSPGGAAPSCPWDSSSGGYKIHVLIRFAGSHSAEVAHSLRCLSQTRGRVMGFLQSQTFEVRRVSGTWTARIVESGIT